MKFLLAPNAFKGSLSAKNAARAMKQGISSIFPEATVVTMLTSDGGDGFVEALETCIAAKPHQFIVTGPTGRPQPAIFLYSSEKHIAFIEMAAASGLALLKHEELDPMHASSIGVGELVNEALELGAQHIVLGIGGSATNDGGTGLATALGIRFFDESSNELAGCAENLVNIREIDCSNIDPRIKNITFDVACDVTNPLIGENGAAKTYGPQKGANEKQIIEIENGLCNLADLIQREFGVDVKTLDGGGAAGGMGAGLYAFFGANLKPGAEVLLDILQFDKEVKEADLVITTEGKLDTQTGYGKAPAVIAARAKKYEVPVLVIAGQIEDSKYNWASKGFDFTDSLCTIDINAEYAISHAAELLTQRTKKNLQTIFADQLIQRNEMLNR